MMSDNRHLANARTNIKEIKRNRRTFHKYSELSFHEFQTAAKVADYLLGLGLDV